MKTNLNNSQTFIELVSQVEFAFTRSCAHAAFRKNRKIARKSPAMYLHILYAASIVSWNYHIIVIIT